MIFKTIHRMAKRQDGNVTILVALLMTFLIGMAALVIDVGRMYLINSRMKSAVDSAALAGAQQLPDTDQAYFTAFNMCVNAGENQGGIDIQTNYSGDPDKVKVSCTRQVDFFLAPVLGYHNRSLTVSSVATCAGSPAFDYAIFSGSKTDMLQVSGSTKNVTGDVHTNNSAKFTSPNLTINGALEAMGSIDVPSGSSIALQESNSSFVPMPVWDANTLKSKAVAIYTCDHDFEAADLYLNGIYFVNGDVHINGNIHGNCSIVATGNIHISGHVNYATANDSICMYSLKEGNTGQAVIQIDGPNKTIHGILYAPNGEVKITGGSTVYGAIIGNTVDIPGNNTTVVHDSTAERKLPIRVARLIE
ncbi:MAG: pilus assembly protein TadG-related protein [Acidobacteriota bacterium]